VKLERELMRGAGPTAVMQLLSGGEKYGYELVEALSRQSNGVLAMGQSTLYPLLYNLEAKGLVTSRVDETGPRPRRFYRLTSKGQRKLAADTRQWQSLWEALSALGVSGQPAGAAGGAR
jgi:PadR family transcriptional regulator PadR